MGLLVALLLLGSAELVLMLAGISPLEIYSYRAKVRWSVSRNLNKKKVTDPHVGYTFTISTDENGLRRTGVDRSGAPLRLLVMGDSVVFGWNVSNAESMPARLQAHLDRLAGEGAVQVINGGQPSFSSLQTMKLLQVIAPIYKPNVVLIQLSFHDTFPTRTSDLKRLNPELKLSDLDSVLARSRLLWILRETALDLMGRSRGGGERAKDLHPEGPTRDLSTDFREADQVEPDYENGVRVTSGEFAWINRVLLEMAGRHGFQLVWSTQLERSLPSPYARVLGLEGGGEPARFIPQRLPSDGSVDLDDLSLKRDRGHMNPRGCDVAAEILARGLVDKGLVPARKAGAAER